MLKAPAAAPRALRRAAAETGLAAPVRQARAHRPGRRSALPRAHYPAPYAIIDLWARYGAHGAAAFEAEARSIAHLFLTETSRNLVRVFLLQDRLKSAGGKAARDLKHVHVVGAGVMGGDIAAWSALRGFTVTLQDRALEFVEPALKRAAELFDKRLPDPAQNAAARARLRADVEGAGVPDADVVIEAIFENLEAKQELYARLEPRLKAGALLATNTSSITLESLAAKLAQPARLVGLHFFNPVAQMPLIEVVHGAATDARRGAGWRAASRAASTSCRCRAGAPRASWSTACSRPYLYEAMLAAAEGVPLALIDRAAVDFGMPMGPIELVDVVGLDVAAHVGEIIAARAAAPGDAGRAPARADRGQEARPQERCRFLPLGGRQGAQAARRAATAPADLIDRLILVLVNECVACLRERVVEDADLVDAAVIFGTGFAPFRGGPLTYARARGIAAVVARLHGAGGALRLTF